MEGKQRDPIPIGAYGTSTLCLDAFGVSRPLFQNSGFATEKNYKSRTVLMEWNKYCSVKKITQSRDRQDLEKM